MGQDGVVVAHLLGGWAARKAVLDHIDDIGIIRQADIPAQVGRQRCNMTDSHGIAALSGMVSHQTLRDIDYAGEDGPDGFGRHGNLLPLNSMTSTWTMSALLAN
jgi:hypothetical protein